MDASGATKILRVGPILPENTVRRTIFSSRNFGLGRRDTSGARKVLRWMRVRTKDIHHFIKLHRRDSANLCACFHSLNQHGWKYVTVCVGDKGFCNPIFIQNWVAAAVHVAIVCCYMDSKTLRCYLCSMLARLLVLARAH